MLKMDAIYMYTGLDKIGRHSNLTTWKNYLAISDAKNNKDSQSRLLLWRPAVLVNIQPLRLQNYMHKGVLRLSSSVAE